MRVLITMVVVAVLIVVDDLLSTQYMLSLMFYTLQMWHNLIFMVIICFYR